MDSNGRYLFSKVGLTLGSCLLVGNEALKIAGSGMDNMIWPISGACLAGGILFDILYNESEYEKLFRLCGIKNTADQVPLVIKKTKNDRETTLVIHMPQGISQHHFEAKKQELEQALNAKIEFGYNKNLIITLMDMSLKSMYPYEYEERENPLEVFCGMTHGGKFYLDIEKLPHAIVSGETESGKSSLLDVITLTLNLSKHDIDLHLIDFQAVTLGKYENCKKVKSYGETPGDFAILMDEMEKENERRLKLFRSVKHKAFIDKISTWNSLYPDKALSRKVVIIDEYARLAEKDYEDLLERFRTRVAMDRKVGIHYIASLQRPDVKCISGSIKANMPTRIAFKTATAIDSEVILDQPGAEKIKEKGRFLAKYCGKVQEVQALYADPKTIRKLLKQHNAFKSQEEIEGEKKERMQALRAKCINPYLKGGPA